MTRPTREELMQWRTDALYWDGVAKAGKSSGRGGADQRIIRLIDALEECEEKNRRLLRTIDWGDAADD